MKKILLTLTLGATLALANNIKNDDLLNLATAGKAQGTSLEMGKEDMAKADGGWYINNYYTFRINKLKSYLNVKPKAITYKSAQTSFADQMWKINNTPTYGRVNFTGYFKR